jgi:hypothetical protein
VAHGGDQVVDGLDLAEIERFEGDKLVLDGIMELAIDAGTLAGSGVALVSVLVVLVLQPITSGRNIRDCPN